MTKDARIAMPLARQGQSCEGIKQHPRGGAGPPVTYERLGWGYSLRLSARLPDGTELDLPWRS